MAVRLSSASLTMSPPGLRCDWAAVAAKALLPKIVEPVWPLPLGRRFSTEKSMPASRLLSWDTSAIRTFDQHLRNRDDPAQAIILVTSLFIFFRRGNEQGIGIGISNDIDLVFEVRQCGDRSAAGSAAAKPGAASPVAGGSGSSIARGGTLSKGASAQPAGPAGTQVAAAATTTAAAAAEAPPLLLPKARPPVPKALLLERPLDDVPPLVPLPKSALRVFCMSTAWPFFTRYMKKSSQVGVIGVELVEHLVDYGNGVGRSSDDDGIGACIG